MGKVAITGNPTGTLWVGPPIYPYGGTSVGIERFAQQERDVEAFGLEGQILYRKLAQATGLPVPDTDTAADWAQATDDNVNQATASIYHEGYTFKNAHLADAVVARMTAVPTMTVTLLLYGDQGMASLTGDRIAGTT